MEEFRVSSPDPSRMNSGSGFGSQFDALMRKNVIFQWRQYKTNCCQILFPMFVVIVLFLLQMLVTSFIQDGQATLPGILHQPVEPVYLMESNLSAVQECGGSRFSAGTGGGSLRGVSFEHGVFPYVDVTGGAISPLLNRTGVPSPLSPFAAANNATTPVFWLKDGVNRGGQFGQKCDVPKVFVPTSFVPHSSLSDLDNSVYKHWADEAFNVVGGFLFRAFSPSSRTLDASVYFNDTLTSASDVPQYLNFLANTFLQLFTGASLSFAGTKDFPTEDRPNEFDLISTIGPFIYVFIFQLWFPVIASNVVYEKESKLREIMKMMGLRMSTYWVITYLFSIILYTLAFLLLWLMATIFQFRYFTINDPGSIFIHFFLWGNQLVAFSFFVSVFFTNSSTAAVAGYIWVFATGLISGSVISTYFTSPDTPEGIVFFLTLIPTFGFYRGLLVFSLAVQNKGAGTVFANAGSNGLGTCWAVMIVETVVFMLFCFYLEAVLPTGYGVKRKPWFLFQKSFWVQDKDDTAHSKLATHMEGESEDVAEHRQTLIRNPEQYFVRVEDLRKTYPGQAGQPDKEAVRGLALGIHYGECFGFLGPNGAGKSSSINILSGLNRPTSGTAFIAGHDIRTQIGRVHQLMGVCPQDNVLWDTLTGPEHLRFFGRLKNLKGKTLDEAIEQALKSVNLHGDKGKQVHQYSGGMKRRLSVACAFMGNPPVVLLDEPSTGLDPASRRQLWDLINDRKKSCAMLLTTHAMEEADALCDRLGIFVGGRLKCIGTSSGLKSRYGKGWKLTVTVAKGATDAAVDAFVHGLSPGAELLNALAGTSNYELPKAEVKLSTFFTAIESVKEKCHIIDWGISNTTLEEVFHKTLVAEEEEELQKSQSQSGKDEIIPMRNSMSEDGYQLRRASMKNLNGNDIEMSSRNPSQDGEQELPGTPDRHSDITVV